VVQSASMLFAGASCAVWSCRARRRFCVGLASAALLGFFVRGGLAYGALLGLTGRLTGERLCDGFIFQLHVPRSVSASHIRRIFREQRERKMRPSLWHC
jgi:hypothetical protein